MTLDIARPRVAHPVARILPRWIIPPGVRGGYVVLTWAPGGYNRRTAARNVRRAARVLAAGPDAHPPRTGAGAAAARVAAPGARAVAGGRGRRRVPHRLARRHPRPAPRGGDARAPPARQPDRPGLLALRGGVRVRGPVGGRLGELGVRRGHPRPGGRDLR